MTWTAPFRSATGALVDRIDERYPLNGTFEPGRARDRGAPPARTVGEIDAQRGVGCFYCCVDRAGGRSTRGPTTATTAMCPKCGIDSVIGDRLRISGDNRPFLEAMNRRWF